MKEKLKSLFKGESEFTKKWMARFTIVVFILLLFYIILSQELLLLYFELDLPIEMSQLFFECYTSVMKVLITGYAVTFVSSMGKAFLAKQQQEKNKLEREKMEFGVEYEDEDTDTYSEPDKYDDVGEDM